MMDNDVRALVMNELNEYVSRVAPKFAACRALSSAKGGHLHENRANHFTAKETSDFKKISMKQKIAKSNKAKRIVVISLRIIFRNVNKSCMFVL